MYSDLGNSIFSLLYYLLIHFSKSHRLLCSLFMIGIFGFVFSEFFNRSSTCPHSFHHGVLETIGRRCELIQLLVRLELMPSLFILYFGISFYVFVVQKVVCKQIITFTEDFSYLKKILCFLNRWMNLRE